MEIKKNSSNIINSRNLSVALIYLYNAKQELINECESCDESEKSNIQYDIECIDCVIKFLEDKIYGVDKN